MAARRCDHVPAVAAHVDAGAEGSTGAGPDRHAGMPEVEVPPTGPGAHRPTLLNRTVPGDERGERRLTAVIGIDVNHDEATLGTSADPDIRLRPACPPCPQLAVVAS